MIQEIEFVVGAFATISCLGWSFGKQLLVFKRAIETSTSS